MKGKLKFNGDWKALLLAHCEKIGIGVVAILVGMFIWYGMTREGLPVSRQPSDIESVTNSARTNIGQTPWEEFRERPRMPNYSYRADMAAVPVEPYQLERNWKPDLFERKQKRADPQLYTVAELRAHAGYGPYAVLDAGLVRRRVDQEAGKETTGAMGPVGSGGSIGEPPPHLAEHARSLQRRKLPLGGIDVDERQVVEGRRWVVVTGVVPVGKQRDEYGRVFKEAMGYDAKGDQPVYLAYYVERADVTDDKQTELNWKQIKLVSSKTLEADTANWDRRKAIRLEDPRYVHPRLTEPVGPLALGDWDERAAHPQVPLAGEKESSAVETKPTAAVDDPFGEIAQRKAPPPDNVDPREKPAQADVGLRLFRFFDYTVEPGRKYRYRFRLVLRDANFQREPTVDDSGAVVNPRIPVKFLEQSVVERITSTSTPGYRLTDWSDPTPVVAVPLESRLLVQEVKPASEARYYDEPSARLSARVYDIRLGVEAISSTELSRGHTVNFSDDASAIDPIAKQFLVFRNFNFNTNTVVLDMRGGGRLDHPDRQVRDLMQPAELLVLDPTGKLVVYNELADGLELEEHAMLEKQQAAVDAALAEPDRPGGGPLLPQAGGNLLDLGR